MEAVHPDFSRTQTVVSIDGTFKNELLCIASTLTFLEPKGHRKPEVELECQPRPARTFALLDLPNEILLCIFEQLEDDSDLYTLAQLSRRMHHLALPIYLARKGMGPFSGSLVLFDERSQDVLQALSIALFRPALKCVYCTFNFYWPDRRVLRNLRGLVRLVQRLSVLHEAHLDFTNVRRFGQREGQVEVESYWGAVGNGDVERVEVDWAEEFRVLFEVIVKKGCTTLTVCLAGWTALSTPGQLKSVLRGGTCLSRFFYGGVLLNFLSSAVRALIGKGTETHTQARSTEPRDDLEVFNLHSAMLLQAELCPWTIRTLNSASICTLSLRNIEIHSESWAVILSCITLPLLSSLSIDLCSITYPDLAEFLRRHPHVQYLYLGRSLPAPPSPALSLHSDDLRLNNLTHLSAAPVYLNYLLAPPGVMPALKAVTIIARVHHSRHFDFGEMNNILLPIAPRLLQSHPLGYGRSRIELTLELSFESSGDDWMLLDAAPDTRENAVMPRLARLELRIGQHRLADRVVARLPRWLGLFSGLREVKMRSPAQDGPTELGERMALVRAIFRRCPRLERLGINDVVRDREGWVML
ncbi:hypothetical protein D9615_001998 [Tricholomella constricta]|uniref:F-box domain-containing protein n=1 Tax=Tricholomella constricta TaxID=117010 RepID=A0A8H5HPM0_9AGAR|nr:hypothetical protein D9615_001998 [Tricholomella constricta]